jgi:Flp pilus assembly protein TadG
MLLLLVLGVVEFGRAWNVYQTITDATRQGTRTAVLARCSITPDTVAAAANQILFDAGLDTASAIKTLTPAPPVFGCPPNPTPNATGSTSLTISYPYTLRWVSGLMGWTGAQASFNMNSSATFRNEY